MKEWRSQVGSSSEMFFIILKRKNEDDPMMIEAINVFEKTLKQPILDGEEHLGNTVEA